MSEDGGMTPETLADALLHAFKEPKNDSYSATGEGYVNGADLTDVTLDGHWNLLEIARDLLLRAEGKR